MSSDEMRMVRRRGGPAPLWSTCTGDVTVVHGEVDISTRDEFATMVQDSIGRAESGGAKHEVHLDLGGLAFIDVSGARVLVTAGAGRGPGSQLVIDHPPTLLARILDVGWGRLTGVRVEASDGARRHDTALTAVTELARRLPHQRSGRRTTDPVGPAPTKGRRVGPPVAV